MKPSDKSLKIADQDAETPVNYCPICGKKLDRATMVSKTGESAEPTPGALTVCIDCGGWLVFRKDLSLRRMDEQDILAMDSETHQILRTVSRVVKEIKHPEKD